MSAGAQAFLRALDALEQGLAFFDHAGVLLHANRRFAHLLESSREGEQLQREIDLFVRSLWETVHRRGLTRGGSVEVLAARALSTAEERYRIRGSYLGLDLLGRSGCVLIDLEVPPPPPLSEDALRERFRLTRQECRIVRLLLEGHSNAEIARRLSLSRHTVRHHLERIYPRLQVRSRTELAGRVLQAGETGREDED